jgi:hypothetical protein
VPDSEVPLEKDADKEQEHLYLGPGLGFRYAVPGRNQRVESLLRQGERRGGTGQVVATDREVISVVKGRKIYIEDQNRIGSLFRLVKASCVVEVLVSKV